MCKVCNIFGAGISGISLARALAEQGYKINIYERNNYVGGNCYDCKDKHGILIHKFGPHIFHTSNNQVIEFVKKFTKFNKYKHTVDVKIKEKFVPLPINFKTIELLFDNAKTIIDLLKKQFPDKELICLYDLKQINDKEINKLYTFLYNNVYANYTSKMWGIPIENVDPNVINRIKIILSYKDNYFPDDTFIGLPINGYSEMLNKMVEHKNISLYLNSFKKITIKNNKFYIDGVEDNNINVYCGPIDELFGYEYGTLPYRSLDIKFQFLPVDKYQSKSVVNYPSHKTMTRISEYKQMSSQKVEGTTISKEFPGQFSLTSKEFNTRYYPINNSSNITLYNRYKTLANKVSNLYLLGRLAEYKYYDMDDAIASALNLAQTIINK